MSLLKDAQKLVRSVRDDEQHRGWDYIFADMIEKLAARCKELEARLDQLENRVEQPDWRERR